MTALQQRKLYLDQRVFDFGNSQDELANFLQEISFDFNGETVNQSDLFWLEGQNAKECEKTLKYYHTLSASETPWGDISSAIDNNTEISICYTS